MAKEILRNLIKFNTIKDKENKEIMNYIEKLLTTRGFHAEYKTSNLVMSIKEEQQVGFLGHTDTVLAGEDWSINPFEMREQDGKLYGLGSCDMKGGIAAILQAVLETDWTKAKSGIKLYFTYDEEIGFSGIKELVDKKEKFPEYMIIGEPTNNQIMNGSKGLLELKLSFTGISTHSSTIQQGENAIEKCIECLQELKDCYKALKKEKSDVFEIGYTTMNIGKIKGGKSINIVPNECEVLIDFRAIKKEHMDIILEKIERLMQKYKGKYEIINKIDPFLNKEETINSTNFITEASFINVNKRYILGVGPMNAHQANEYITEESLDRLVEQYKTIIHQYCY